MNDPHVVALIFTVEHGESVDYKDACPLSYSESPEFHLTVDNNRARFELMEHYADETEALRSIESFMQHWEFEAGIRSGPGRFKLHYEGVQIIDRNPSPTEPGVRNLRASLRLGTFSASARITHVVREYPSPPSGGAVDPDDSAVAKMKNQYEKYRLGRLTLPPMAYFCLTVLEERYGNRHDAAAKCLVDMKILE